MAIILAVAAAGCSTARDSVTTSNNSSGIQLRYGELAVAVQFTAGASYTCCAMDWFVSKAGSSSDLIYAEIYADDGGGGSALPTGAALTTSDGIALSALANGALQKFENMSRALTSGTKYWRVIRKANNDNSNYPTVHMQNAAGARVATNTGSWAYYADRLVNGTLYSA